MAAEADCIDSINDIAENRPLEAGQLAVKGLGTVEQARLKVGKNMKLFDGIIPLGGWFLHDNGTVMQLELIDLETSIATAVAASSHSDATSILMNMTQARGKYPVLAMVTAEDEPNAIHGIATQISACVTQQAYEKTWDSANESSKIGSLALLLGCLFGVTSDAIFNVSKKGAEFPAADVCVACLDAPPNMRLHPCGHAATCEACWNNAQQAGLQRRCFLCRQIVSRVSLF